MRAPRAAWLRVLTRRATVGSSSASVLRATAAQAEGDLERAIEEFEVAAQAQRALGDAAGAAASAKLLDQAWAGERDLLGLARL